MKRKLSIIMAADIVGYSRLMAENEASTYADLRAVLDHLVGPTIERRGGGIFKTTGDGFLAMFQSVNEAVDAAIEIQKSFDDGPFELRIGINLGDVIEDKGDMYGDGVNVAARLEQMAGPGQILVSGAVVMATDRNRSGLFAYIGRRPAKNIPESLVVYSVRLARSARGRSHVPSALRGMASRLSYGVAALALVLAGTQILPLPLAAMVGRMQEVLSFDQVSSDPRPAVAVMPFASMGGSEDQSYFADGLTEDITTALARNAELQVIARDSTFAARGPGEDIRRLGQKLGVSYLVEGSARREGQQLRIVAQLIDVDTGSHLWSRSFDREVSDIFALQSELTTEIAAQLVPYISRSETVAAAKRPTENLQSYDLLLRARDQYRQAARSRESLLGARGLYQRALEIDPGFAAARAGLALTYITDVAQNPVAERISPDLEIGVSEARQAVSLDPNLALAYHVLSYGLAVQGDYAGGLQAAKRAIELNPNDPDSMMALAKAQVRFGDYGEAVANAERARRLHPLAPEYYAYVHGQALYAADRLDEAAAVIGECLLRAPADTGCLLIQAALQSGRGQTNDAQVTMGSLVAVDPGFSLNAERTYRRFGDTPLMERFLVDIARARAPENA